MRWKIKPLGAKVLVGEIGPLPQEFDGNPQFGPGPNNVGFTMGKVIAVGIGDYIDSGARIEPECAVGDFVILTPYATSERRLGIGMALVEDRLIEAIIEEVDDAHT